MIKTANKKEQVWENTLEKPDLEIKIKEETGKNIEVKVNKILNFNRK